MNCPKEENANEQPSVTIPKGIDTSDHCDCIILSTAISTFEYDSRSMMIINMVDPTNPIQGVALQYEAEGDGIDISGLFLSAWGGNVFQPNTHGQGWR